MRDEPHAMLAGRASEHAAPLALLFELQAGHVLDVEIDDVGLHARQVALEPG